MLCFIALFAVNGSADHHRCSGWNGALMTATAGATNTLRFPLAANAFTRYGEAPVRLLVDIGQMVWFALTAVGQIPYAVRRYPKSCCE